MSQELKQSYAKLSSNDIKIIVENANTKVVKEEIYKRTIGNDSLRHESNDNCLRLINFAESKNMRISFTFFLHKNMHKGNWKSLGQTIINQIDHVLIENRGATSIMDVRSFWSAYCGTDNFLFKSIFRSRINKTPRGSNTKTIPLDIYKLRDPEVKEIYLSLIHI